MDILNAFDKFDILRQIRRTENVILNYIAGYAFLIISTIHILNDSFFFGMVWLFLSLTMFMIQALIWHKEIKQDTKKLKELQKGLQTHLKLLKQLHKKQIKRKKKK